MEYVSSGKNAGSSSIHPQKGLILDLGKPGMRSDPMLATLSA